MRTRCPFIFAAMIYYASMIYPIMVNMGYLQLTDRVCANIIQSYTGDALFFAACIGVLICVTGGHPVNGFPLQVSTECILFPGAPKSDVRKRVIITFWCLASTLLAASGATTDAFVEIAGAFGGSSVAFVFFMSHQPGINVITLASRLSWHPPGLVCCPDFGVGIWIVFFTTRAFDLLPCPHATRQTTV